MELCSSPVWSYLEDVRSSVAAMNRCRNQLTREVDGGRARRTAAVNEWVNSVQEMERSANDIYQEASQLLDNSCLGEFSPIYCWSAYMLTKKVINTWKRAVDLCEKGEILLPRARAIFRIHIPENVSAGLESKVETVLNYLQQDDVAVVGLYGMAAAGKTVLMSKINNYFYETGSSYYDEVIWVQDFVYADKTYFWDTIRQSVNSLRQRNEHSSSEFRNQRILFLIDDVWERVDLSSVGVKLLTNFRANIKVKLVLTTRSEEVCRLMGADRVVRVEPLKWDEAWTLFQQRVGSWALNSSPEIRKLAESVTEICDGQPWALTVVALDMVSKQTPQKWKDAVRILKESPWKFPDIESRLLAAMTSTYRNLPNLPELPKNYVRYCFLFCSMYPIHYEIQVERLIEQWIGQRYIGGFATYDEAVNIGRNVIGTLMSSCLLESGKNDLYVKMNFWARAMGVWTLRNLCDNSNREALVRTGKEVVEPPRAKNWRRAEVISLTDTKITRLNDVHNCPRLSTLLVFENHHLKHIHDGFFLRMPLLQFLVLSDTGITKLPSSIGKLVHLEYLDISRTLVAELPSEMKNLIRLKYFILNLGKVAVGDVLKHLKSLQVLRRPYR